MRSSLSIERVQIVEVGRERLDTSLEKSRSLPRSCFTLSRYSRVIVYSFMMLNATMQIDSRPQAVTELIPRCPDPKGRNNAHTPRPSYCLSNHSLVLSP
jgi:hypothetical protein